MTHQTVNIRLPPELHRRLASLVAEGILGKTVEEVVIHLTRNALHRDWVPRPGPLEKPRTSEPKPSPSGSPARITPPPEARIPPQAAAPPTRRQPHDRLGQKLDISAGEFGDVSGSKEARSPIRCMAPKRRRILDRCPGSGALRFAPLHSLPVLKQASPFDMRPSARTLGSNPHED